MVKTMMMNTKRLLAVLALGIMAWGGATATTIHAADDDQYRTKVEVRIGLPPGVDPDVSVVPTGRGVLIELPSGSEFPEDFTASTGGLVRDATVTLMEGDRIQLELQLALGLLDRVHFSAEDVTLLFHSRFAVQERLDGDSQDDYHLGPDDKILVTVHGHDDLTSLRTITDSGFINAPLVGDVRAAGLTPRQLASQLTELLGRDYLVDPQIDVEVEEFESQWVMVAGEIRVPGRVPLRGGTKLKEVLSEAGGFGMDAGELITITRNAGESQEVSAEINRSDFEDGIKNPMLQNGDIITISKAMYAFFQGEVGMPGRVRIERDTTLMKAISQVGGLTDWANRKEVQIIAAGGGVPQTYNLKGIQSGRKPDPPLTGGEIVIVKRRFF